MHSKILKEIEQVTQQGKLRDLTSSIAIDIDHWLNEHVEINLSTQLLGGLPFELESAVSTFVQNLKAQNLSPIFVFPGLPTASTPGGAPSKVLESASLVGLIRQSGAEAIRAPYRPSSQLAEWLADEVVQQVYGTILVVFWWVDKEIYLKLVYKSR